MNSVSVEVGVYSQNCSTACLALIVILHYEFTIFRDDYKKTETNTLYEQSILSYGKDEYKKSDNNRADLFLKINIQQTNR